MIRLRVVPPSNPRPPTDQDLVDGPSLLDEDQDVEDGTCVQWLVPAAVVLVVVWAWLRR